MEKTIDTLLAMSTEASAPATAQVPQRPVSEPPFIDPQQLQQEQDEMMARALQNELNLSESRENGEPSTNDKPVEDDLSLKEVKEKFNQFGEAAKHKFKELSMFFKKDANNTSQVDPSFAIYSKTDDDAAAVGDDVEIIAFDARNVRKGRKSSVIDVATQDDETEEDPSPHLVDRRAQRAHRLQLAANGDAGGKVL